MIKYNLEPVDLEIQKFLSVKQLSVELADNYLRYIYDVIVEKPINEDDPGLGFEKEIVLNDCTVLRRLIAGITMYRQQDTKERHVFKVVISVNGLYDDIRLFFETRGECYEMLMALHAWWLVDFKDNKKIKSTT